jgi:ribosomal protein L37AE/L43A
MSKTGAFGIPGWAWGVGIVAAVWWIASEKLRNPRCKDCDVALQVIAAGSKYLCPQCGAVATGAEVLFGLA